MTGAYYINAAKFDLPCSEKHTAFRPLCHTNPKSNKEQAIPSRVGYDAPDKRITGSKLERLLDFHQPYLLASAIQDPGSQLTAESTSFITCQGHCSAETYVVTGCSLMN